MPTHPTIRVVEPSNHHREKWPITVSVPFPRSTVTSIGQVHLLGPHGSEIPAQRRIMAMWPDGSVKWMLLDFAVELEPRECRDISIEVGDHDDGKEPEEGIRIEWAGEELHVDTGVLRCRLAATQGGLLSEVVAHGITFSESPGTVRIAQPDGRMLDLSNGPATLTIEEPGIQRAVIAMRGKHFDLEGNAALDYVLRMVVYANQAIVRWYYTIVNREPAEAIPVSKIQMIQPLSLDTATCRAFVGTDRTCYSMPEGWVSMATDGLETRAHDGNRQSGNLNTLRAEVQMEPFIVLGDATKTITVLPRWCHFLFPKAVHYYGRALRYDIWPDTAGVWNFRRGMAKTHELLLAFSHPAKDYESAMPAVAPVLRPVIATVNPHYIEETNAVPFFFAARGEAYPQLETHFARGFRGLARAYGMLHYGDANGVGYSAQGRGRHLKGKDAVEEVIWVNNEYDMPYMAMLQFLRTGDRKVWLQTAEPHVWHMMDVDTIHSDPAHPINEGGQSIHLANHIGPPGYGVDPSHEWVEGLITYHLLTGLEHPREHALALGEHLLRWTEAHRADLNSDWMASRVTGWALIALTALFEFTRDERYRACALAHGKGLHERVSGTTGHLTESVSYGFPYRAGFMTNIAVIGLKRLWDISGDNLWKDLALKLIEDQWEHLSLPTGLLVYKELPENRYPSGSATELESMAYAWQWTKNPVYLKRGIQLLRLFGPWSRDSASQGTFFTELPDGGLSQEIRLFPRDSHSFSTFRYELPFLRVLHDTRILKQFEPPEIDLSQIM